MNLSQLSSARIHEKFFFVVAGVASCDENREWVKQWEPYSAWLFLVGRELMKFLLKFSKQRVYCNLGLIAFLLVFIETWIFFFGFYFQLVFASVLSLLMIKNVSAQRNGKILIFFKTWSGWKRWEKREINYFLLNIWIYFLNIMSNGWWECSRTFSMCIGYFNEKSE